jgi:hypothetical protein
MPPNTGAPRRIIIDATSRIQDNMAKGEMRNLGQCRCALGYILLPPLKALRISICFNFCHDADMLTVSLDKDVH